jgi:hypothetical protein
MIGSLASTLVNEYLTRAGPLLGRAFALPDVERCDPANWLGTVASDSYPA